MTLAGVWRGQAGGREQVYGSVTQAVLNGLQPNTVYSIKIEASNRMGVGQPSIKQTIKTLEEAPEGPPQDVSVKSISSEALEITWKVKIYHLYIIWNVFHAIPAACQEPAAQRYSWLSCWV